MTGLTYSLLQIALWAAVGLAGAALAVAVLRKWYGSAYGVQPTQSELLTKFRDLHGRGGLSDDEYRTIKTKLAGRLDSELSEIDKKS
jgi:hypothetical protein